MAKGPTKLMWKRMFALMLIVVVLGFGTASVRLVDLMLVQGGELSLKASNQQLSNTTIAAERGTIYDCNKNVLATSATVWTVYITPKDIETDEEAGLIADGLSEILELDRETVYKQTQRNTAYEKVKQRVEENVANEVRAFIQDNKLGSIVGLDETTKRYYPNGSLASTVLGFVGDDNQGLYGIEYQYDTQLQGVPGKVVASKNARGSDMPFNYETMVEAQQGNSLVLTIDEYIQYCAEKYLDTAVISNNCTNRGCVIVMDIKTGGILAMATKPDFDPNEPFVLADSAAQARVDALEGEERSQQLSLERQQQWRNKAVSDTYEPGSVFKIVTGSAALEENKVSVDSTFDCNGSIVIAGTRYKCHKAGGHGHQNLTNAFENSCNPAFIEISQRLGVSLFYKYFKAYGMTQLTGIDLPGEAAAIYHAEENMGPVQLASEGFGQTFRITPIQLITAMATCANGGSYIKPHVVSQILDADGNIVQNIDPVVERQVISSQTSATMREMLESVVSNGGGKNAYVAGYRVAGKTGTSQKIDQKDESGNVTDVIASFCGFAPADDPQVAVLVMLDEPHVPITYGGTIAAPVAGQIFGDILPYMGIEPQYTEDEYASLDTATPNVVGDAVAQAQSTLNEKQLKSKVVGSGDTVVRQVPVAGQTVPKNCTVVLYTSETDTPAMSTVPDFNGMTVSQVNTAAAAAGVNVSMSGISLSSSGAACYQQSVAAGEQVESGTVVTVQFRYQGSTD